ncbi:hypothetical protein ROLI_029520 [Roseobacter fucihabitans]|uniref:Uncharacterized protein n=1 Tax=Roseobacter fucihabitans TaxID=1537242 RepID=A0ABZ2BXF7_9RHOB|nr:hypothetical protein [Roseobacter litoralis]MBC6965304.1 hypothetical protein [Roseobacter litoralis]
MKYQSVICCLLSTAAISTAASADVIVAGNGAFPLDLEENSINLSDNVVAGNSIIVNQVFQFFRDATIEVNSDRTIFNDFALGGVQTVGQTEISTSGNLAIGTAAGALPVVGYNGATGELIVTGPEARVEIGENAFIGSAFPEIIELDFGNEDIRDFEFSRENRNGGVGTITIKEGGSLQIGPDIDETTDNRGFMRIGEVVGKYTVNGLPQSVDINGPDAFNGVVTVTGAGSSAFSGDISIGNSVTDGTGHLRIRDSGKVTAQNLEFLGERNTPVNLAEYDQLREFGFEDDDLYADFGTTRIDFGSRVSVEGAGSELETGNLFVGLHRDLAAAEDINALTDKPVARLDVSAGGTVNVANGFGPVGVGAAGTGIVRIGDFGGTDSGLLSSLNLLDPLITKEFTDEFDGEVFVFEDEVSEAIFGSGGQLQIGESYIVSGSARQIEPGNGIVEVGKNGLLNVASSIDIGGHNPSLGFGFSDTESPNSKGELIVSDGGIVTVGQDFEFFGGFLKGQIDVDQGGRISGDGGTIVADVNLQGGTIAPGASPGRLDIDGNLTVTSGLLEFEIAGNEAGLFDQLFVSGSLLTPNGLDISISFLDEFLPSTDDVFDLFKVAGSASIFDTPELINFSVAGVPDSSAFLIDFISGVVSFAQSDTPVSAVPLPAGLPMLAKGLFAFGYIWRRKTKSTCTKAT